MKILILTLIIELSAIIGRLAFGSIRGWHGNLQKLTSLSIPRIHHGYIGIALLLIAHFFHPSKTLTMIGAALLLSDLLHHFVVLPLWIGRTEFS